MKHAHPTAAPDSLISLAHRIHAGDYTGLPKVDYEYFDTDDWQREAQAIVDCGEDADTSDLQYMIDWEQAHSDWMVAGAVELDHPSYAMIAPRGLARSTFGMGMGL